MRLRANRLAQGVELRSTPNVPLCRKGPSTVRHDDVMMGTCQHVDEPDLESIRKSAEATTSINDLTPGARMHDIVYPSKKYPGLRSLLRFCGCRGQERASNQRVTMLPVRLLWPWDILKPG